MWNSRRKMFDFNCKVVFHLEGSFMSSLLLLIQPKRKKKQILLLLFLFQWWNAKGSHFCWNQVTSYMKTQKPCRIQALSGPGSLGAKISQNLRQTARGHPWSSSGQLTHPIARTRLSGCSWALWSTLLACKPWNWATATLLSCWRKRVLSKQKAVPSWLWSVTGSLCWSSTNRCILLWLHRLQCQMRLWLKTMQLSSSTPVQLSLALLSIARKKNHSTTHCISFIPVLLKDNKASLYAFNDFIYL